MKKHRHSWQWLGRTIGKPERRHCFHCNTTQKLADNFKWVVTETAKFWSKNQE